jgi:hypothetical protein
MIEESRINYDSGDSMKIGAASQFFTETAVTLITAMGNYRDEIEREADESSGDRMKAIREALEFSWAGTHQAMAEIAFVMRFDPQEVIDNLNKALESTRPVNDNEVN